MPDVCFIDETYNAPIDKRLPLFYLLAGVVFPDGDLGAFGSTLQRLGAVQFAHASSASKTREGMRGIVQLVQALGESAFTLHFVSKGIENGDKYGERARALAIASMCEELYEQHSNIPDIRYDKRLPGYQANADSRTFGALMTGISKFRNINVKSVAATQEVGIIAADIACWAFKRNLIFDEGEHLAKIAHLIK